MPEIGFELPVELSPLDPLLMGAQWPIGMGQARQSASWSGRLKDPGTREAEEEFN